MRGATAALALAAAAALGHHCSAAQHTPQLPPHALTAAFLPPAATLVHGALPPPTHGRALFAKSQPFLRLGRLGEGAEVRIGHSAAPNGDRESYLFSPTHVRVRSLSPGPHKTQQARPAATATSYALVHAANCTSHTCTLTLAARQSLAAPWLPVTTVLAVGSGDGGGAGSEPRAVRVDIPAWPWDGAAPAPTGALATAAACGAVAGGVFAWMAAWRAAARAWGTGPVVWARVGARLEKVAHGRPR